MEEQKYTPPNIRELQETFRLILLLTEEKIHAINNWARANIDMFYEEGIRSSKIRPVARELNVSLRELANATRLISTFMNSEYFFEALNFLKEQGTDDFARKVKLLLNGIDISSNARRYLRQRTHALHAVMPTLQSFDAVCDLRAVFKEFLTYDISEEQNGKLTDLIGLEPIVLMSLDLNDGVGNKITHNFQLTGKELQELLTVLQRVSAQLEVITREKHKIVPPVEIP
jgi:hypothetical protein